MRKSAHKVHIGAFELIASHSEEVPENLFAKRRTVFLRDQKKEQKKKSQQTSFLPVLLSWGDLRGGLSRRLMLGGSAGECSASDDRPATPGDGSLLIIDSVSLVFLPGFSSRYTTGGGNVVVVPAVAVAVAVAGVGVADGTTTTTSGAGPRSLVRGLGRLE